MRNASYSKVKEQSTQSNGRNSRDRDNAGNRRKMYLASPDREEQNQEQGKKSRGELLTFYNMIKEIKPSTESSKVKI